jgi:hydrogenase maturation protein HypF
MSTLTHQPKREAAELRGAMRVIVAGRVQGIGFRPAVARLAQELALAGEVRNTNEGAEIVLEGPATAIDDFLSLLASHLPTLAQIERVVAEPIPVTGRSQFQIAPGRTAGSLRTAIPLDSMVCEDCLGEVNAPRGRRSGYPFTSCTACGPRYSGLQTLPYERAATTMAAFALCDECRQEYDNPSNRRFHAESIACPACGPRYWLSDSSGAIIAEEEQAIGAAASAIRQGQIVALRGIGGYQLLADATSAAAVQTLRDRKRRPAKPLAVMVDSLGTARKLAYLKSAVVEALTQPAGPIVVAPLRPDSGLAKEVCRGLKEVGLMLPTSPLHWLIARNCPPLIATSGNMEGEPLEHDVDEAHTGLAKVADFFLDHDRPIARPIDDSVVRMIAGRAVTIRAARGLAPLQLRIDRFAKDAAQHCILAVGGQQNNAVAIWNGHQAVLGPHLGNLDEVKTCQRWHTHIRDLTNLLGAKPTLVVHDLHPDYYATRWAEKCGHPTIGVQHHHAHTVAGMIEHNWLDREVLGVAWDGTGFGPDGTIWGGEFLRATAAGYHRVARLRPFNLLGGEAAIREPWRLALALLHEILGPDDAIRFLATRCYHSKTASDALLLLNRTHLSPLTSSVGRLFDAVATVILPPEVTNQGHAQYEGQLAMLLESACEWPAGTDDCEAIATSSYPLPVIAGEPPELDWRPLLTAIIADCQAGIASVTIARRFHAALASAIVAVCDTHRELPVVLGGGVFQNRVLTELVACHFSRRSQPLGLPGNIPPGDGGLAAGQLAIAMARLGNDLATTASGHIEP